jgi:predicted PolB exonuclease-like 3'-5' exonuclease
MLKSLPSTVWAFDCEWVPDAITGRKVYFLDENISDSEVIKIMWKEGGATEENPQPFLKLILSKVVSIAIFSRNQNDSGEVTLDLFSLPDNNNKMDEKELIERFLNGVGKKQPQLVGFNSHDSDLPVLLQRGLAVGVTSSSFSKRPNKPWEGYDYFSKSSEAHIDIRAILSGWGKGASPSLHQLAVSCGIPGKLGVDGNQVHELWIENKIQEIVDYNECDSITTYLVWLRMAYFSGFFDDRQYNEEQLLVKKFLIKGFEEKNKKHFKKFLDAWEFSK